LDWPGSIIFLPGPPPQGLWVLHRSLTFSGKVRSIPNACGAVEVPGKLHIISKLLENAPGWTGLTLKMVALFLLISN